MNEEDKLRDAAARLDAHDDYRVLRRIPPSTEWQLSGASGQSRRGLFVDVETTGLDTETDEIIEVALLPFDYDPSTGDVIAVHEDQALNELRDAGIPIPAESSQVHGITDDVVKGKVVDDARLNALVTEWAPSCSGLSRSTDHAGDVTNTAAAMHEIANFIIDISLLLTAVFSLFAILILLPVIVQFWVLDAQGA